MARAMAAHPRFKIQTGSSEVRDMRPYPICIISFVTVLSVSLLALARQPTVEGKVVIQGREDEVYPPDVMKAKGWSFGKLLRRKTPRGFTFRRSTH
ncbi:MAG: hypothetical protein IPK83_12685 [Planctomycetes bacterium]|nr:hypothetical protein [Planctomycetota bacterium]